MGQPRRLTRDVQKQIVRHVSEGNYPQVAAQLAGIPTRTFNRWLHDGREDLENGVEDTSVARLAFDVEKARAQVVARKVKRIQDAGEKQWQADAWWLERNFPQLYGKRIEAKVEERVTVVTPSESLDPAAQLAVLEHMKQVALKKLEAGGGVVDATAQLLDEHTESPDQSTST